MKEKKLAISSAVWCLNGMGDQSQESKRGLLARLRPELRAAAIGILASLGIALLIVLDAPAAKRQWSENPAALVEQYLNTLVLAGTVWAVLFEGEAILAALGRAIASGAGGVLASLLKAAGASQDEIKRILNDIRDALKRGVGTSGANEREPPSPPAARSQPIAKEHAEDEGVAVMAAPAEVKPSSAGFEKSSATNNPKFSWLRFGVYAGAALFVAAVVIVVLQRPPPPQRDGVSPPLSAPPEMVEIEIVGSVSQTLAKCLGKQPGADLERRVATFNSLKCQERSTGLRCVVREGAPLKLPTDVVCAAIP